ncbi:MAG: sulfite exporter TauE/SafE family protein [Proteobacteria bacterium]|nr:sulfite exporter TauE/SafE family protein [Pseudomonadota bacterium]
MNSGTALDLMVAFNLGLASQVHCVGMCGGIVAALNVASAPRGAVTPLRYALAYNGGRILSYALAGALLGAVGGSALTLFDRELGYRALRYAAGAILVLNGLALAGWLPRGALFEGLGLRVWRHLQKLGRGLMPINSTPRALAFGMVWGWLPCALVYSTLMLALASASPWRASAIMVAFGLGTLPALLASFWLGSRAGALFRGRLLRLCAALLLIGAGLVTPFIDSLLPSLHAGHAGHSGHDAPVPHESPMPGTDPAAPMDHSQHMHHHSPAASP